MDKVMVFGTFDIVHPGHLDFFRQAKKHGDYLVVVVARDKTVKKLKRKPQHSEQVRLHHVENVPLVDHARLGYLDDPYRVIKEEKPDVICVGYDQTFFLDELKTFLKQNKMYVTIHTLKPYNETQYKSRLLL